MCSETMQQIYRRRPRPKCDFSKVANSIYSDHFFLRTPLDGCGISPSPQNCVVYLIESSLKVKKKSFLFRLKSFFLSQDI